MDWHFQKMLTLFYILLMLRHGRSTDNQIIETQTAQVGNDVKLTCSRKSVGNLFWIRFLPGKFPEIFSKPFSEGGLNSHISSSRELGIYALNIRKIKKRDAAVYYCVKIHQQNLMFLKGVNLSLSEPDLPAFDSVTLQCSVLSDSGNQTCPQEHTMSCLSHRSNQSKLFFCNAEESSFDGCEKKEDEGPQSKERVFSFFVIISFKVGMYICAVVTCGQTVFGNGSGSKFDTEVINQSDSSQNSAVLFLMCAALPICLIVTIFLAYLIKLKKTYGSHKAAAALQRNAATVSYEQENEQQTDENAVVYSTLTYKKKADRAAARATGSGEDESLYSDIRVPGSNNALI